MSGGAAAAQPAFSGGRWLLLSDIHFDPYADPLLVRDLAAAPAREWGSILARGAAVPSRYGADTNYALLESTLAAMRRAEPDPPVVVVAGDFLAHEFPETFRTLSPGATERAYDAFVDGTIAFLALELGRSFPRAQFVVTVGNNDGYCGDYRSTPDSPFLAHMALAWGPLVDRNGAAPDFARTFPAGGYYTATLPTRLPLKVVSVNSVLWSVLYDNACGVQGTDPGAAELVWLKTAAVPPPGGNRWFLMHIPPTMDAYDSQRSRLPIGFLQDRPSAAFLDIAFGAARTTAALVAGHTHHPSFPVFVRGDAAFPGIVLPSISPVQGNNPAFVAADVDAAGTIVGASTYALYLSAATPAWNREYDVRSAYGIDTLDARSLQGLTARLDSDRVLRASFSAYYPSFSLYGGIDPAAWPWYGCANDRLAAAAYMACVNGGSQ